MHLHAEILITRTQIMPDVYFSWTYTLQLHQHATKNALCFPCSFWVVLNVFDNSFWVKPSSYILQKRIVFPCTLWLLLSARCCLDVATHIPTPNAFWQKLLRISSYSVCWKHAIHTDVVVLLRCSDSVGLVYLVLITSIVSCLRGAINNSQVYPWHPSIFTWGWVWRPPRDQSLNSSKQHWYRRMTLLNWSARRSWLYFSYSTLGAVLPVQTCVYVLLSHVHLCLDFLWGLTVACFILWRIILCFSNYMNFFGYVLLGHAIMYLVDWLFVPWLVECSGSKKNIQKCTLHCSRLIAASCIFAKDLRLDSWRFPFSYTILCPTVLIGWQTT